MADETSNSNDGAAAVIRRRFPAGTQIRFNESDSSAYLIEAGILAASPLSENASAACVALVGPGTLLAAEVATTVYQTILPVTVAELPTALLDRAMRQQPQLQELYRAQLHDRLAQAASVAACNAQHPLAQRCARWLLRLHGCVGNIIPVTHEFIAALLGVRRAGVSVTLEALQRDGMLRQQRGRIIVLDAQLLEGHACKCLNTGLGQNCSISADMVQSWAASIEQPRIRIETEIKSQQQYSQEVDQSWARREAVLRVCPAILAQGRSILTSSRSIGSSQPTGRISPGGEASLNNSM